MEIGVIVLGLHAAQPPDRAPDGGPLLASPGVQSFITEVRTTADVAAASAFEARAENADDHLPVDGVGDTHRVAGGDQPRSRT
jgi:hypothetical protein